MNCSFCSLRCPALGFLHRPANSRGITLTPGDGVRDAARRERCSPGARGRRVAHMPRRPRTGCGGLLFHVMNRGARRAALFNDDSDYRRFARVLREANERIPMGRGAARRTSAGMPDLPSRRGRSRARAIGTNASTCLRVRLPWSRCAGHEAAPRSAPRRGPGRRQANWDGKPPFGGVAAPPRRPPPGVVAITEIHSDPPRCQLRPPAVCVSFGM